MNTCYHFASPSYLPSDLDRMAAKINHAMIHRWRLLRLRDDPSPAPTLFEVYDEFADSVLQDMGWASPSGPITDCGILACASGLQPLFEAVSADGFTAILRLHIVPRRLMVYLGPTGRQWLAQRTDNVYGRSPKAFAHNVAIGLGAARAFLTHPSVAAGSVEQLHHLGLPVGDLATTPDSGSENPAS